MRPIWTNLLSGLSESFHCVGDAKRDAAAGFGSLVDTRIVLRFVEPPGVCRYVHGPSQGSFVAPVGPLRFSTSSWCFLEMPQLESPVTAPDRARWTEMTERTKTALQNHSESLLWGLVVRFAKGSRLRSAFFCVYGSMVVMFDVMWCLVLFGTRSCKLQVGISATAQTSWGEFYEYQDLPLSCFSQKVDLNNGSNIIKPWALAHGFMILEPLFK